LAGILWDQMGAASTFYGGAIIAGIALLLLFIRKN
jgi:predicted MFS family arabinose efflux permease